jgi:type II secretion system-associated lipoprotein
VRLSYFLNPYALFLTIDFFLPEKVKVKEIFFTFKLVLLQWKTVQKSILFKTFFPLVLFFFIFHCQRKLIRKDELELLNEHYGVKTYFLKEDVSIGNREVIEKGTSVRIWIESTPTLLKVKCYPSNADREGSAGKMVTYLINEDLKDKEFTVEDLESLIDQKLSFYLPKDIKSKKAKKK